MTSHLAGVSVFLHHLPGGSVLVRTHTLEAAFTFSNSAILRNRVLFGCYNTLHLRNRVLLRCHRSFPPPSPSSLILGFLGRCRGPPNPCLLLVKSLIPRISLYMRAFSIPAK